MTNAAPTMEARNVLVTGAIRGLGLAFVKHLLSCSTHLVKLFAACRDPGTAQLSSVKNLSGYGLNFNVSFNAPCRYNNPLLIRIKQGKSEGFESCDRPIVRKRPIWVKTGDVLYRVTLKFDGWPWKTIGHLSFAVSSFVQHFIAIGEFKLELQSGNAQFGSNSTIFRAVWPWNLTDDLQNQ